MARAVKIVCFALAVASLGLLGLLAASCGNGNAQYRVVNAISDTSTLDPNGLAIYMNGGSVWTSVPFTQTEPSSAGKYQNQQGGADTIDVYPEASAGEGGDEIINSALNLSGDTQYTVVLTGNESTQVYAASKFTDDNSTTKPTSGNALFRIINASAVSNPNGVDVYILPPGTSPTNPPTSPMFNSTALLYQSATAYTNVGLPPGNSLTVYVTPHGERVNYALPLAVSGLTGGISIRTIVIMDTSPGVQPLQLELLTEVN